MDGLDLLSMHVITVGTKDYGDKFVVRVHHIGAHGVTISRCCTVHESLDQARGSLPGGLVRASPADEDDPVIVETWL